MRFGIRRGRLRYAASTALVGTLAVLVGAIVTGAARPGTLVQGFGEDGIVTTDFRNSEDVARAVAPAPDGRLVVAGQTNGPGGMHMGVARYLRDGTLDATFGTGGRVEVDSGRPFDFDQAFALDVNASGQIVVAGSNRSDATGDDFAVAVLTRPGTPDASFGVNALVTTDFGGLDDGVERIRFLPGGKILAVGRRHNPATEESELVLARYRPDGSLDTSFAAGGWLVSELPVGRGAIDPRGDVVALGDDSAYDDTFLLARYTRDGSLDPSFGDAGAATVRIPGDGSFDSLALMPDGRIVIGGNVVRAEEVADVAVVRLTRDGALDPSFGIDGIARAPLSAMVTSLAVQPDGRILAAGFTYGPPYAPFVRSFAVLRFDRRGRLDTGFGEGGITITPIGARAEPRSIALLHGGDIAVAGFTEGAPTWSDFAVARYHGR